MRDFLNRGDMVGHEVKAAGVKTAVGGLGAATSALTLNEWVAIVTIVYFIMQIAYLGWKWRRESREGKKNV